MNKKKMQKNEIEELKKIEKELRNLKSIKVNLRKKIKNIKNLHKEKIYKDGEFYIVDKNLCEKCGKGIIEVIDLGKRAFKACNVCSFRTKTFKKE